MNSDTGWVLPPTKGTGLDHLGAQAPCIFMYGTLLPGITNVTDRARYYTFYPWFFWAYNAKYKTIVSEDLVEKFRRADCLFTLIAERHAQQTDKDDERHGIAMVGRSTLVPALTSLANEKSSLALSDFSTRDSDSKNRYFKNKYGGLGQYYFGPLRDLGLFVSDLKTAPRFTEEIALPIVEAMDKGVDRSLFFQVLEKDFVTLNELDRLKSFCPCQLNDNESEHDALKQLLFNKDNRYGADGKQRKLTLGLILQLINDNFISSNPIEFNQFLFRASVYTSSLPGETPWTIPAVFNETQRRWATYQKNELLSMALQGIFWVALDILSNTDIIVHTVEDFTNWFCDTECVRQALDGLDSKNVGAMMMDVRKTLPSLSSWQNSHHEIFLGQSIREAYLKRKQNTPHANILRYSLNTILALAVRSPINNNPYSSFYFPEGYFSEYRINLLQMYKMVHEDWQRMTLRELIGWLAGRWGIENHLHVALRKLHHERLDTFQLRPTEKGFIVINAPEPIFTSPRFRQAIQILKDLQIIEKSNDIRKLKLSKLGQDILGDICGS